MELERKIEFTPAFDKRDSDPNKNYGIRGVNMCWYLIGLEGAVQFVIYTNWQLPHVQEEFDHKISDPRHPYLFHKPMAADIGYHAKKPSYEGQTPRDGCHLIDGPCYYDGSSLPAQEGFDLLLTKGGDAVWEWMEKHYQAWLLEKAA